MTSRKKTSGLCPARRLKMTEGYEMAFLIGGLFLSLSAFSLILGDNYLFRLGAAILGGAVSAYICVLLAEKYFYPMILEYSEGGASLNTAMILRAAAVLIGILLLFCGAYTGSRTGGRIILTIVLAFAAVILLLGAAGGTIPSFIKMLSAGFRVAALTPEEKSSGFYWLKTGTVVLSAVCALFYTRHYRIGSSKEPKAGKSLLGDILVGFSFGAVAAAVFITAANIFVNHVSRLIGILQSLMK